MSSVKPKQDEKHSRSANHAGGNPDQRGINEALIARWTRRLGIYTGVLAIATVLLFFATGISAFFLWDTDQAINGQLREAHSQNLTTRAQVRAYMAQEDISTEPRKENDKMIGWMLTPVWKNTGSTEATGIKGWWALGRSPSMGRNPIKLSAGDCPGPQMPDFSYISPIIIGADHKWSQLAQLVTADDVSAILEGKLFIFALGRIEYRDIFPDDPIHFNDWCVLVSPFDSANNRFSFLNMRQEVR